MMDVKTEYVKAFQDRLQTPSYLYFINEVYQRLDNIKKAFKNKFDISYSLKANPNRRLVSLLNKQVQYYDASSIGEFNIALDAGIEPERITFVGPGKTDAELREALSKRCGYVVVEDESEIHSINKLGQESNVIQNILIRINPLKYIKGFGINMSTETAQFGVPEEHIENVIHSIKKMTHIQLRGFHVFTGTQCLDEGSLVENIVNVLDLFKKFSALMTEQPKLNIIGAGFGIPFFDGEKEINLDLVNENIVTHLESYFRNSSCKMTKTALELGRYVIGEAGIYVSRVVRIKQARKCTVAILEGGMNHNAAATGNLGTLIKRNYKITTTSKRKTTSTYYLYGPLCTKIDLIAREIELPALESGDILIVQNSGAYGFSASPLGFITHKIPREYLVMDYNDAPLDITSESNLPYIAG